MSAAACAKKLICRNKIITMMEAACKNVLNLDGVLTDEQVTEISEIYIKHLAPAEKEVVKYINNLQE